MQLKYTYIYIMVSVFAIMFGTSSCKKTVSPTSIIVLDSIRHYYPLLQGEEINMSFRVANVGKEPLVITDIMPSCGCIVVDQNMDKIILPQKEGKLYFKFKSQKFSGYVKHTIRIFGNINPKGMAVISFDLSVVPPYNYSPDYEELFRQYGDDENLIYTGKNSEKQYFVPSDAGSSYTRSYFSGIDNKK